MMNTPNPASRLDQHLRLRLEALSDGDFERFFLHFLNAGISLTIMRDGQPVERRIIDANTYAAGTGRKQKGIDLIAKVEGGETWVFQCKRHKAWNGGNMRFPLGRRSRFRGMFCLKQSGTEGSRGTVGTIRRSSRFTRMGLI